MSRKSRGSSIVDKLIEQRRLIQDWLRKLDAGQTNGMPERVVARVRNDYAGRLEAVTAELGQHADGVRQGLSEAQARHEELSTEQEKRRDELAELRLRRQVGEVDEPRFKEQQGRLKSTLDDIAKEMTASLRDIDRLEDILDVMGRGEDEGGEIEDELEDDEVEIEVDEAEAEPEPEPAPRKGGKKTAPAPVDELSFLRSVTGVISAVKVPEKGAKDAKDAKKEGKEAKEAKDARAKEQPAAAPASPAAAAEAPPAAAPPPAPPPAPAEAPAPAAPAPAPAPAPPPPPPPVAAAPAEEKVELVQNPVDPIAPDLEHQEAPPAAGAEAEKPFFVLEQMPEDKADDHSAHKSGEGERSLACRECGALNLPTEWYCEKCGAELAAF